MNRRLALLALTLAFILGGGCGPRRHLYPGPEQAIAVLAKLECYRQGTTVELRTVDGQKAPTDFVFLQPGRHRLLIAGPPNIAAADAPPEELTGDLESRRPTLELEVEVEAGMHYFLGATLGELAFLKTRSDQSGVWEQGFYATWSLDVYAQTQGAMGLPPLLKSYPQKAE